MVEFNGVDMSDVAPVLLLDIAVASPAVQATTQSRPLSDGTSFVRRTRGERTVAVSFVLMEQHAEKRRNALAALTAWLASPHPLPLRTTPEENGYLLAVCTRYPDQSSRQYWEALEIVFTAFDPAYRSLAENVQPVDSPVMVARSEPPLMRIEQRIDQPLTAPRWTLGSAHLELTGTVGVGQLIIDFDQQTILLNGQSALRQLTIDSVFFTLNQGANRIVCTGGAGGTLYWRERWI